MNIEHPAYPVREFGGLVFIYMGPPGTEPLLPVFDVLDTSRRKDIVLRGMRLWGDYAIGFVRDCNWLQHFENVVDPWHVLVLHQSISGDQFDSAMMVGSGQTSLGVRYKVTKSLPNGISSSVTQNASSRISRSFRISARRASIRSTRIVVRTSPGWCPSTTSTSRP
jgi:phenylpropionate dioxygenase-like ring-hydroxylating dioxygenase large terminal subunit